jgi:hypothetical protein
MKNAGVFIWQTDHTYVGTRWAAVLMYLPLPRVIVAPHKLEKKQYVSFVAFFPLNAECLKLVT